MKDIIQVISNLENLRSLTPASMEEITEAEKDLSVKFADDYIQYVEKYGVIRARGFELTGVTVHERLSVVSVTRKAREMEPNLPANMYVIENVAIDGILALQDETGKVYAISPGGTPKLMYNSLTEYIENATF